MNHVIDSLPEILKSAVDACLIKEDLKVLQTAVLSLSERYRQGTTMKDLTKIEKLAYLAVRLPATYRAAQTVLANLPKDSTGPKSLLDLGSGPGTFLWAALDAWPSLNLATLLERDNDWIDLAKNIYSNLGKQECIQWKLGDLTTLKELPFSDVVALSYVLTEIEWNENWIKMLWQATKQYLILIEPGTPRGFKGLRQARTYLTREGAYLKAPCTHEGKCPLEEKDWCHFSTRLKRIRSHRLAKMVQLGYEDEKFCYLIFSRQPVKTPKTRVIKRPKKGSGHVLLDLCGPDGLERRVISKKQKDLYSLSRKTHWGGDWPP